MTDEALPRVDSVYSWVRCTNDKCVDHNVDRRIYLPALGANVFLDLTTGTSFGLSVLNLFCGSCRSAQTLIGAEDPEATT